MKVPPHWIEDDAKYAATLDEMAASYFPSTGRVVSIKYYTAAIVFKKDLAGEQTSEHVKHLEQTSPYVGRRFPQLKDKDWRLFPAIAPAEPPLQGMSWNGMPVNWKRLFFFH